MPTASDILKQVTDTYAACSSYRDDGDIVTAYIDSLDRRSRSELFDTFFIRPSHFRHLARRRGADLDSDWHLWAIWRTAEASNTFCSSQRTREQHDSLGIAIASLGGPGVAISNLLLEDEVGAFRLIDLVELKLDGHEDVDGHRCFRISAQHPRGGAETLWIDTKSRLLRRSLRSVTIQPRSEEQQRADFEHAVRDLDPRTKELWRQRNMPPIQRHPFHVETTTRYKPEMNGAIELSTFDFIPPDPPPERPGRRWFPPQNQPA